MRRVPFASFNTLNPATGRAAHWWLQTSLPGEAGHAATSRFRVGTWTEIPSAVDVGAALELLPGFAGAVTVIGFRDVFHGFVELDPPSFTADPILVTCYWPMYLICLEDSVPQPSGGLPVLSVAHNRDIGFELVEDRFWPLLRVHALWAGLPVVPADRLQSGAFVWAQQDTIHGWTILPHECWTRTTVGYSLTP